MAKRANNESGFTVIETIVAGVLMVILAVGVLSVFETVTKLNRINSVRLQAHSLLQKEVEYYRSLKFVPVNPDPDLDGQNETRTRQNVVSQDGSKFDIYVTIDNDPFTAGVQIDPTVTEANCRFKEIRIRAVSLDTQSGVLQNIGTDVSFQRVRLVN